MAVAVCLCAIAMLPVAWFGSRNWIFPDSISYFDMASDAVQYSPAVLLKNAYWSPAYPAILALMMLVVRPAVAVELQAIYVVHWLIFLFTTLCFTLLLQNCVRWLRGNSWTELSSDGRLQQAFISFAYVFFLLANMNQTLWYATPDMLTQGLVYLSAAYALRLFLPDASWKYSAALGVSLGVGYLSKAALFPVGLILLGILFLKAPKDRLGRRHAVIALACFGVVVVPLVMSLSQEKHRFTFGDSGKLNYAYHVGDLPQHAGWIGQNPENGTPAHAPRVLSRWPLMLEFRTPVRGTLPIWYDPSYWWEGLKVPIRLDRQLVALFRPFSGVHSKLGIFLALAAALAPLCLLSFRVRKGIRDGGILNWILLAWPAAACLMYALVLFNFRYVAGFVVLICVGGAAIALRPFPVVFRIRALLAATALLAVGAMAQLRPAIAEVLKPADGGSLTREEGRDNGPSSAAVASELTRLGIRPGDEISALGHSFDCYYARLLGVKIIAQIWEDADKVENLGAPQVQQILDQLRQLGVKAMISRVKPGFVNDHGWVAVPRTDVYVRML